MAGQVQRLDDPGLLRWRHLGAERDGFEPVEPIASIGHASIHVAAEKDIVRRDPDLAADLAGDDIIVAGEDFDAYPRVGQRRDRSPGALLWRIEKGDVPE